MRAKSGRWWTFFSVFALAGVLLTWQPALAVTFTEDALQAIPKEINQNDTYSGPDLTDPQYIDPDSTSGNLEFSFRADQLADWLKIDKTKGILSGTPTNSDVGTVTNVTITVKDLDNNTSDKIGPFDIAVINVNDPPKFSATPSPDSEVTQGKAYYFKPSVTDIDGDNLSFSLDITTENAATTPPVWLNLNETTGELSGIPKNSEVGLYNVTLTASDGEFSDNLQFQLTVLNKNDPPTILPDAEAPLTIEQAFVDTTQGQNPTAIPAGSVYRYVLNAEDPDEITPDGETLEFNLPPLPDWLEREAATQETPYGAIVNKENRPNNSDVGDYRIENVSVVDDSQTEPLSDSIDISISVTNANDRPRIGGTPKTEVLEKEPYSFQPEASDPDGDKIVFQAKLSGSVYPDGWPEWLIFSSETGLLSGTPGNSDAGQTLSDIEISVSDGELSSTLPLFDIKVVNVNDPPKLELFFQGTLLPEGESVQIEQKEELLIRVKGSDVDPDDALEFSMQSKPQWMLFTPDQNNPPSQNPGIYFLKSDGALKQEHVGEYTVVFSLTDDVIQEPVTRSLNITVLNVNDAPTVDPVEDAVIDEGAAFSVAPVAKDIDGDTLIYEAFFTQKDGSQVAYTETGAGAGWPGWLNFDPNTGNLSIEAGATGNQEIGAYSLQFGVSDREISTKTNTFKLTIENVNQDPVLSGTPKPKVAPVDIGTAAGQAFSFTPTVFDPDKAYYADAQDQFSYFVEFETLPNWMTYLEDEDAGTITFMNRKDMPTQNDVTQDQEPTPVVFQVFDGQGGFDEMSFSVQVTDFIITKGDLDGSGTIDLSDAVLGLQLIAGIEIDQSTWLEADVNADDRIGLQDVIYILMDVATP